MTMSTRVTKLTPPGEGHVVNLGAARERARLTRCRERVEGVLEQNRRAVETLFQSGLVFSRSGSKAGRDLLGAHQQLLRMADVVGRAERGQTFDPLPAAELDTLFCDIERLLEKTSEIARRNRSLFTSRRGH